MLLQQSVLLEQPEVAVLHLLPAELGHQHALLQQGRVAVHREVQLQAPAREARTLLGGDHILLLRREKDQCILYITEENLIYTHILFYTFNMH